MSVSMISKNPKCPAPALVEDDGYVQRMIPPYLVLSESAPGNSVHRYRSRHPVHVENTECHSSQTHIKNGKEIRANMGNPILLWQYLVVWMLPCTD